MRSRVLVWGFGCLLALLAFDPPADDVAQAKEEKFEGHHPQGRWPFSFGDVVMWGFGDLGFGFEDLGI
jgi:hypothetical protein